MNFIWDLDGTLLNSYGIITGAVLRALKQNGITRDAARVREYIIKYSVRRYFTELEKETGVSYDALQAAFEPVHDALTDEIVLMPGAKQTLETLSARGDRHFIATHRTETAYRVLENTGILHLFTDIITAKDGFKRKPAPDCVYHILEKHSLRKEETWYVGDRSLDIECGKNAGIGAILYFPEGSYAEKTGKEDFIVSDLTEIPEKLR